MEITESKQTLIGACTYQSPVYRSKSIQKPLDDRDDLTKWLLENTFGRGEGHRLLIGMDGTYTEIHNSAIEVFHTTYHRQITVRWQPLVRGIPNEILEELVQRGYTRLEE